MSSGNSRKNKRERRKHLAFDYPWWFIPAIKQPPLYAKGQGGSARRALRQYILWRDGTQCHWCKRILEDKEVTIDHFFPKRLWLGTKREFNHHSNLVISCWKCNWIKADKSPIGFTGARPEPKGLRIVLVWVLRQRGRLKRKWKVLTRPKPSATLKA